MSQTVKVAGLRELEAKMKELGKALSRGALRRVASRALAPIAEEAKAAVEASTEGTGALSESIAVGTRLSRNEARAVKQAGKDFVEMYVGAGPLPQAHWLEFGTGERFQESGKSVGRMMPEPYMRPAWDANKAALPERIGRDLWAEIEKTAARKAKRDAKRQAAD